MSRFLSIAATAALLAACDGPFDPPSASEPSVIWVVTSTSGPGPHSTHTLWLNTYQQIPVPPNDSTALTVWGRSLFTLSLKPGEHCLTEERPKRAGPGEVVRFTATCVGSGILRVLAPTSGPVRPGHSHGVAVMGARLPDSVREDFLGYLSLSVRPNESSVVRLTVGDYQVALVPAPNCFANDPMASYVDVELEGETQVELASTCVPEGRLTATVSVEGADVPESFPLRLTGDVPPFMKDVYTVPNSGVDDWLSAGEWTGELRPPFNCTVDGTNPVPFTVTEGTTTVVPYRVTCVRYRGTLRVTITTTGTRLPPGFTLGVDRDCDGWLFECWGEHQVPTNGTWSQELPAGEHRVGIFYVPSNCTVAPAGEFGATVLAGEVTTVAFTASCQ